MLIAIILIMAFTPLGYLKAGTLSISLITIPTAIGAAVISPGAGALLGGVFGLTSFIQCFTGDPFGAALLSINPFLTFLLCVPTRILAGFLSGLLFRPLRKKLRKTAWYLAGFLTAFFNTAFFMTTLVLFFWNAPAVQAWSAQLGALYPLIFILSSVTVNAVIEWIATTLIAGSVGIAMEKAGKTGISD